MLRVVVCVDSILDDGRLRLQYSVFVKSDAVLAWLVASFRIM